MLPAKMNITNENAKKRIRLADSFGKISLHPHK
jgi:hypothetical protein